ncbi:ABC transporter ATP-binding protein [Paenibacillus athensensis]|uniref:Peptide ABC transporter ATP-binding protein n=1 Tax=Paenibacillus athensensis TaxID=1967502 RepID=A0A4Y8PQZ4_9BACL|nr:ABC transporter ATP-binding protein [Paenibacillus athensensis]MCD1261515.1 ABC transporter ATP-binding protein [Paenibacillus athensensis]
MEADEALVTIDNLHVVLPTTAGDVHAVRGVSLTIGRGEVLALVGESGSGKSVTAKTLLRLLPSASIRAGSIRFDGRLELTALKERQLQRVRGAEIGMVFQDPMTSLNPTMTLGAQLVEGLVRHRGLRRKAARQRACKLLAQAGLGQPERRLRQYPHELSGGMRQRAMIAMALACEPKLLIADEPTTALDVTVQAQMIALMQDLTAQTGASVLLITHDWGVVAAMARRVAVMYAGRIVEQGPVDDVYAAPRHPYTQGLLRAVPRLEAQGCASLTPIPGAPPSLLAPPAGCAFAARCPQAQPLCREAEPPPTELAPGHSAACWLLGPVAAQEAPLPASWAEPRYAPSCAPPQAKQPPASSPAFAAPAALPAAAAAGGLAEARLQLQAASAGEVDANG